MGERWRDRLRYFPYVLQRVITPTAIDRTLLPMPDRLSFLCCLLRPTRLIAELVADYRIGRGPARLIDRLPR
jgi:hypothetical protein